MEASHEGTGTYPPKPADVIQSSCIRAVRAVARSQLRGLERVDKFKKYMGGMNLAKTHYHPNRLKLIVGDQVRVAIDPEASIAFEVSSEDLSHQVIAMEAKTFEEYVTSHAHTHTHNCHLRNKQEKHAID